MSDTTNTVDRFTINDWQALRLIRLESLADTPEVFRTTLEEASTWSDDH